MRFRFLGQWMLWVCLLLVGSEAVGQTTIFNETFNEGNGAVSGVDQFGTAWSVSCPTCEGYYEVVNNKLEQNNSGTSAGGNILPQFTTSNIDVSNCNTLTVRMMYEGDSYAGSGNFESEDECPNGAPTCAGDPDQFDQLGCFDCWDFFLVDLVFNDATTEQVRFIGANGDIPATAPIDYESSCLGNRTQAFLRVRTQTWGSGETNMMDNVMIICNDPPSDINITQDPSGSFCEGDAVELAVNNAPGESFEWFDPNDNPIGGSGNSISFAASDVFGFGIQTFSVVSTDFAGCKSMATRNIIIDEIPDADLPLDMTVCEGEDITLQETASDATGWMWSGPASGAPSTDTWVITNATLANSGTYTVSVTDGSSCIGTESVNVTVEPGGTFNLATFADICENDAPLVLSTTQDGIDGNWSGFGVSSNVFDPASVTTGNYNLTFTPTSTGCLLPQQAPISVIASPLANSPVSPLEACGSGSAIFNLSTQDAIINGGTSLVVTWYEDAGLMNPISDPANFDSPSATVYAVLTENGCTSALQQLDLLLTAGPQIMMPADIVACGSFTLDPITIVDGSATEAYYSEPGGNGTVIPVGTTFTQDTVVYAFDSNGSCTTEQEIRIAVGLNANPGADLDLSLCSSGFINLLDYVDPSADPGNFEDGVGNVIAGNMILAEDFVGTTIQLFYRTDASGGCPSETAMYTIQVGLDNQAGPDTTARACFGQEYDLADFTYDQGMSGTFEMLDGTQILDTRVSLGSDVQPTIDVRYIVATSLTCAPDTANIALIGEAGPLRQLTGSVCSDYSTLVNGATYNLSNPFGTEIFTSGEFCDSIVFVDLQFRPDNRILFNNTLCTGEDINVNGIIYNEANPIGTEIISNGDQFGCDSIIEVDLTFDSEITTLLDFDLCSSKDTVINGVTYNAMVSTGSATIMSSNGCDSIVMVDLNILQSSDSLISGLFCPTDSLIIEGEVFNLNRPDGMFLSQFTNAAGCDSMIFVDLEFDASRSLLIDSDLCSDRTVNINGTEYGASNPIGIETVAVPNECDSLYTIDLNILQADTILINETFCSDTSIVVNNVVYDRLQSQGEEVIQGASASGCNQYVIVDLEYIDSFEEDIAMELCYGDSIVVNGVTYSEGNPLGIETLQSANGCDSIINVDLTFTGIQVDFQEGLADCITGGGATLTIDIQQGVGLVNDVILDGISILDQYQVSNLIQNILPGDHEVDIFSNDGCSIFYAFTIDEQVEESLSINVMNADDQFYQLEAIFTGQIASVFWSPSEGLSCIDCLNPEARPPSNTSYTVQVTDENGCPYMTSIELRFLASSVIYQPNIFSPNEDGFNDIFFLDSEADFDFTNFAIFDRWGNQVFQKVNGRTGDPSLGWDGLGHEEGVYVYFVDLNFPDGSQTLSGEFSLIR